MSQHDYNIANQTFPATRTDLNNALGAVATNNAGNSAPSTTYANQWWFDLDDNKLYMRNKDNDAWVEILTIGATSDKVESIGVDDLTFADNSKLILGTGGDLEIYHDGSNSYIDEVGTGDLYIKANNEVRIQGQDGVNLFYGQQDGSTALYYDGTSRIQTTPTGGNINGFLTSDTLNVGTTTSFGSNDAGLKIKGGLTIGDFANDTGASQLHFVKSRNTTVGSQTIVNDDDSIGGIFWKADDGNDSTYNNNVAGIEAQIDGTPGTNDSPGRLIFYTTADGARTNTERLRIDSSGVATFTSSLIATGLLNTVNNSLLLIGGGNATNTGSNLTMYGGSAGDAGKFRFRNGTTVTANVTGTGQIQGYSLGPSSPTFSFTTDTDTGMTRPTSDTLTLVTGGTERLRVGSGGNVLIGTTDNSPAESSSATGMRLGGNGGTQISTSGMEVMRLNRNSDDGNMLLFAQAGTPEGGISISGSTVSYGGFTGSHWSRLSDNSKPEILRGTIMESIDEMCDWYQAVVDVPEVLWTADDTETQDVLYTSDDVETQDVLYTEEDELPEGVEVGDVKEPASALVGDVKTQAYHNVGDVKKQAYQFKESISLGDKSIGDSFTFTKDETEYTGIIVKEDDVKHTKSKISDTANSKKVYGVFSSWDDADDGLDGDVNDMHIAQVGTYIIRVNADEVVEAGDLLVSNGDGTAKVQDDDIIRSKTVAKVNSTVIIETYADGSYTVPCTLHC